MAELSLDTLDLDALEPSRELDALVEKEIFGDDLRATTDGRLASAFHCFGDAYRWSAVVPTNEWIDYSWPGFTVAKRYWDAREGQPWQHDLEQHVADWRAEPRPFSRAAKDGVPLMEPVGEIVRELERRSFSFGMWSVPLISSVQPGTKAAFRFGVHPPEPGDAKICHPDPRLAIIGAALKAVKEERNG